MSETNTITPNVPRKNDRTLVVLDFENIYIGLKKYNKKWITSLNDWLDTTYKPVEKVAFLDVQRVNGQRALLTSDGWTINDVLTSGKKENPEDRTIFLKNAVDMSLALFTMDYAYRHNINKLVLLSGDGDYAELVKYLKRKGIEVTAVCTYESISKRLFHVVNDTQYLELILNLLEEPKEPASEITIEQASSAGVL